MSDGPSAVAGRRRSQATSDPPPPPPMPDIYSGAGDTRAQSTPTSGSGVAGPPPPPLRRPPAKPATSVATVREEEEVATRQHAGSIAPPPPPPFPTMITNGTCTREVSGSPSPPPPPPPPPRPHPSSSDESGDEDAFDFDGALDDDDDDSESGEDDSDLDPSQLHEGSSMSTDDSSILATALLTKRAGAAPAAQSLKKKQQRAARNLKNKLSFTAPTDSSPISSEPVAAAMPGTANAFQVAPRRVSGAGAGADGGVSLASLSTQIALHMELANFAHQRKKSIIMSGAAGNSLIPQMGPSAAASATAAAAGGATGSSAGGLPRRTTNIRSMSMSLAGAGAASFLSGLSGGLMGAGGGSGAGVGPSPAFAAVRAQIGQQIRSAAAEKRRSKRKPRGDDVVLDLFGDQAAAAAAAAATVVVPAASAAASSSTPTSALRGGKRRSIFTPAHPMPDISESEGGLTATATTTAGGLAANAFLPGGLHPAPSSGGRPFGGRMGDISEAEPTTPRSSGATPLQNLITESGEYPPAKALLSGKGAPGARILPPPPPPPPPPAVARGSLACQTPTKEATPLQNLLMESGEYPPARAASSTAARTSGSILFGVAPSPSSVTASNRASLISPPGSAAGSPPSSGRVSVAAASSTNISPIDLHLDGVAVALGEEGDDVTASFLQSPPSPQHISQQFPFRKALRCPLRSHTCLLPPAPSASLEELDSQRAMLAFLLDTLRSTRSDFRTLCLEAVRNENASLRELLVVLATQDAQQGGRGAGVTGEAQQKELTRRALKRVGTHAEWNTALHDVATHAQLTLEDLRRRIQLHLPAAADEEMMISAAVNSMSPAQAHTNHPTGSPHGGEYPPAPRPALSLAEISAKAKTLGLASSNLSSHSSRDLLSPPTPSGGSFRDYPDSIHPSASSSTLSSSSSASQAQLQRFGITKINRIRKNTPRILEIDLTTRTMVICKQSKASSSSKGDKDGDQHRPQPSADFTNRDIVISPGDLVSAELHAKNELQFELSFLVHSSSGSSSAASGSGAYLLPASGTSGGGSGGGGGGKSSTVKSWKVLFTSRSERERFYRLLQVTLLTSDSASSASSSSPSMVGAGLASHHHPGHPPAYGGGVGSVGGGGGSHPRLLSHHSSHHDEVSSAPPSTLYPAKLGGVGGGTTMQTYTPRAPALTPSILAQVRLLPLLPLASSLHTIWCLHKKSHGFKYGLKLVANSGENARKTHPYLVPFHALPPQRRDYNLKVVTATLATVLALGFSVRKPFTGEDTLLDGRGKEKLAMATAGATHSYGTLGGGGTLHGSPLASHPGAATPIGPSPASPFTPLGASSGSSSSSSFPLPSLGSSMISPDLLSHVDLFAESAHDLWAEDKLIGGWRYAPVFSQASLTHPGLVPYALLQPHMQEKERNQAYKILGTLVEYGYELVKGSATTGGGAGGSDSGASAIPPMTPTMSGTLNSNPAQPIMGSLRRPAGTQGAGVNPRGSPMAINSQTFAPPT